MKIVLVLINNFMKNKQCRIYKKNMLLYKEKLKHMNNKLKLSK
jgi:hypothetical protein